MYLAASYNVGWYFCWWLMLTHPPNQNLLSFLLWPHTAIWFPVWEKFFTFNLVGFNYRHRYTSSMVAFICIYVFFKYVLWLCFAESFEIDFKIMWVSATVLSKHRGLSYGAAGIWKQWWLADAMDPMAYILNHCLFAMALAALHVGLNCDKPLGPWAINN